jgi:hypothetical protein
MTVRSSLWCSIRDPSVHTIFQRRLGVLGQLRFYSPQRAELLIAPIVANESISVLTCSLYVIIVPWNRLAPAIGFDQQRMIGSISILVATKGEYSSCRLEMWTMEFTS